MVRNTGTRSAANPLKASPPLPGAAEQHALRDPRLDEVDLFAVSGSVMPGAQQEARR